MAYSPGLAERLRSVMTIDGERQAFDFKGICYRWRDVYECFSAVESALDQAGIGPEMGIGCVLRNRPAHIAAVLAVLCSHRCVVTINPFQGAGKVAYDIRESNISALIADSEDWALVPLREAVDSLGALGIELGSGCNAEAVSVREGYNAATAPRRQPRTGIGILMLTSGTTGPAKRVPLPYQLLEQNMLGAMASYEAGGNDQTLRLRNGMQILFSPLVHIGGFYTVIGAFLAGRGVAILEKFNVPDWLDLVRRHRPKVAALPPSAIRMIYDAGVPKEDLASFVALRTSTAPMPIDLQEAFEARYGIPLLGNYGATEFGGVAGWTLADYKQFGKQKRGSVGRVEPGCRLRVVNESTGESLAADEVGLLEVQARNTPEGEWIRTTDLARIDADGFLFLHGRADDAIVRGGFKVLPDDVKRVLEQHPSVKEAAVVGISDRRLGAVPVAALELVPGVTRPSEEELIGFLRERMVAYQVPVKVKILDELPRTPSLKISRYQIQKLFNDSES